MNNKYNVILVGKGEFAKNFEEHLSELGKSDYQMDINILLWDDLPDIINGKCLALHAGSGRQLPDVFNYCQDNCVPLVQASTGVDFNVPKEISFPYIEAPNLSVPIIKLFKLLGLSPAHFKDFKVDVLESHQSSKTTTPGTAVKIAELLGGDPTKVRSIRDEHVQESKFNVPKEHLNGHAIHKVKINGLGAEIEINTRILGRKTYVYGVLEILKRLDKLENKKHFISDLF